MRRLLLASLCLACIEPAAPLPSGAERFDPPPIYRTWWSLTEQCSGRRGSLEAVAWYVVPGARTLRDPLGHEADGYWSARRNRIVLAGDWAQDGPLVRHEMLHALDRRDGHARDTFVARCLGVVECSGACLADAGPAAAVDPMAVSASPQALDVGTEITPPSPGAQVNGGHFTLVVRARNPQPRPLVVSLPPPGDAGPPVTAEFHIDDVDWGWSESNWRAWVPEASRFAAGETKQF
ncbi:MAG TPA: hypothetical protein VEA99_19060, partial [Gemmatimonadaceae bacterium]|nr:hypothetical protein [Gemmatimonadaceae bacterium]